MASWSEGGILWFGAYANVGDDGNDTSMVEIWLLGVWVNEIDGGDDEVSTICPCL